MDLRKAIIHLARRRQFLITNVYLSPHHSDYSPYRQDDQSWLDHLPKEPGLVCGDINAHHSSLDDCVSADPRDSALHDWMEAHSKAMLDDGSPARSARVTKVLESLHRMDRWCILPHSRLASLPRIPR